eukprot:2596617-Pyramimonas_sp.AAC.1
MQEIIMPPRGLRLATALRYLVVPSQTAPPLRLACGRCLRRVSCSQQRAPVAAQPNELYTSIHLVGDSTKGKASLSALTLPRTAKAPREMKWASGL